MSVKLEGRKLKCKLSQVPGSRHALPASCVLEGLPAGWVFAIQNGLQ